MTKYLDEIYHPERLASKEQIERIKLHSKGEFRKRKLRKALRKTKTGKNDLLYIWL